MPLLKDIKRRFELAYEIVKQKILHTKNLLKELVRYYNEVDCAELEKVFATQKKNFESGVQTVANLLNYEGRFATFYRGTLIKISLSDFLPLTLSVISDAPPCFG